MRVSARRRGQRGLTLVELIVAFTIIFLLASMAVPLARGKVRRERERELRIALREIRTAIDKYKDHTFLKLIPPGKVDSDGYPENLEQLVEGVRLSGSADKKMRFLRKIPKDPMTNSIEWGLRSSRDEPASMSWGGQNVFDVYTKSTEKASDGTPYSEW
ncbi:MAG TPA: type II secretion system protein [Bryobacteraceae bacterium]|nr:type II secretion system protein [Bryobacteraceae bacterium]